LEGSKQHFMLGNLIQLETVARPIRHGLYHGPLVLNYLAIGGGAAGLNPTDLMEFAVCRRPRNSRGALHAQSESRARSLCN
jgi:hypothetical protein